jgi:hypothetical protein
VQGNKFRTTRFPLRCVRPFLIREVFLASDSGINVDAPDVEAQVKEFLEQQVGLYLSFSCEF